ncbi:Uncharacterised protein [Mycobacteroides abscessus]|nr:Uncharacterised protein [Mycobacteroides abscessus]
MGMNGSPASDMTSLMDSHSSAELGWCVRISGSGSSRRRKWIALRPPDRQMSDW